MAPANHVFGGHDWLAGHDMGGSHPGKRLKVHSLDRIACYGAIRPMVQFPVIFR